MGVEKEGTKSGGGQVGGFFQLFDWTSKSRKKLFASKSDVPAFEESLKQAKNVDDSLAMTWPYVGVNEDEIGAGASVRGSDHSCASSVTDDEACGTRVPGVVARLMGLDSLPPPSFPEPSSSPYFDTRSLQDAPYCRKNLTYQHDQAIYSGNLFEKVEGSSRNFMEPKPQKILSRPIEKFRTEVLPPKSAKSIPVTRHKLLSPIKSPGFVPGNNPAYIMEAVARIVEPGPQATAKHKTPSMASSSLSLKVRSLKEKDQPSKKTPLSGLSTITSRARDLKEHREVSQRKIRLSEPSQKNWNGSRGLTGQKEHHEPKPNPPLKTNAQKSMQKKSSVQGTTGVLRKNNEKQNCSVDKGKLPSKPLASSDRKVLSGNSSYGRQRSSSSRSTGKSKSSTRKSRLGAVDCENEVLYASTNNFPRKKRSTDKDWNDQAVDILFIDKTKKPIECNLEGKDSFSWVGDVKRKDMDVVSFTFTTPLTRNNNGFDASGQVRQKGNDCSLDHHTKQELVEPEKATTPVGCNVISGDALSILLEQKLREFMYGVDPSCNSSDKARTSSSIASNSVDPTSSPSLVNHLQRLQQKDQDVLSTDALCTRHYSDISPTSLPELTSKYKSLVADGMKEFGFNQMKSQLLNCRHSSPIAVLEPSCSTESCESLVSTNAANSTGESKLCSFVQDQEVFGLNTSRKSYHAEADTELSDSASSTSTGRSSTWELDYVKEILCLCNVELMFMDFVLGQAREIVRPHLFSQLESMKEGFENVGSESRSSRIHRKVIFDCVSECMDIRCRRYARGGYKMWAKGVMMVRKNERLADEVYEEICRWGAMGDSMVDELVDKDMSGQHGGWLDFNVDATELGAEVEDQMLDSLVNDFVAEIWQYQQPNAATMVG
ncbi:uncharacterized protein LOC114751815 [Neltuma alba]|uniref:uncharacterized protein LOC114711955 n=1 Tax=Neltuma alba TaxID=207710 RepID=UPI0010A3369E|nr:uncharacterized protein LOC114711955 [Prosopis alba]XP_028752225.1 uncharacterized protein LOC114711955 [Prosopis alba]XP_028752226.1 uncharacterized protein LOC114711955 [Prosopis alba]XP_028752227.1 uncharacterized protein LOC114711955 [Prosopis alba]XP_028796329.1 uncharacterized protein LOC114751815 [Prosopis alba]XP_028796330.1 uncharacterized protein LOC114751815 [Prosopis alba]XP_028796331.1 uncharacterized protein LOC114751815 [Prosopis alba]XP_028796332.1 uncharacterized protein 